ncbi:MAG: hypothetical protein J5873_03970 [Bacteroidales bacterium]|nr:hypothetical protein [Bacteroidales bacterium]
MKKIFAAQRPHMDNKKQNTRQTKRFGRIAAYLTLLVFALGDLCYSFVQHYNEPLDGDMAESVLPLDYIRPLYADPFGFRMLAKQEPHAAPNRFFSHYLLCKTYRSLPFALQKVTDPIHSLYYSNAICKTGMQLALILLISAMVCGGFHLRELKFMAACFLSGTLMQTCGFTRSIGMIDPAVTYAFFYALPLIFLLFYLLPFLFKECYQKDWIRNKAVLLLYTIVFLLLTCFSGAISPAVALVAVFTGFARYFYRFFRETAHPKLKDALRNIPRHYLHFLLPLGIVALYSLYIGTYNTMWNEPIPLSERYRLLPQGFLRMFTAGNGGFGLLFALCVTNYLILKFKYRKEGVHALQLFHWFAVFSVIYLLLLPLGGYRPYRPYIIRYDSVLPVSFLWILYFTHSSLLLLRHSLRKPAFTYLVWTGAATILFLVCDTPRTWRNDWEMAAMEEIRQSPLDTVPLSSHPTCIASWIEPTTVEASENAGKLLYLWQVTDKEKRFWFPGEERKDMN